MSTSLLDRVPVDRIEREARQVQLGRALLNLLLGLFWAIGWLAGMVSVGLAFAWASVKTGWQDARGPVKRERARAGPA